MFLSSITHFGGDDFVSIGIYIFFFFWGGVGGGASTVYKTEVVKGDEHTVSLGVVAFLTTGAPWGGSITVASGD